MKKYAFYLPQFHSCESNSDWGENFTDWLRVKNSLSLYPGHDPKRLPLDGEYDLADLAQLKRHSDMQKRLNLDAFAIYHYRFSSTSRALYRPLELILENKEVRMNFFLSWVNVNWTKSWVGKDDVILHEQKYDELTVNELINEFISVAKDERYEWFNGKPVLYIHKLPSVPQEVMKRLQATAKTELGSEFFIISPFIHSGMLPDCAITYPPGDCSFDSRIGNLRRGFLKILFPESFSKFGRYDSTRYYRRYEKYLRGFLKDEPKRKGLTCLVGWDNTSRYGIKGRVLTNNSGTVVGKHVRNAIEYSKSAGCEIFFIKAFNEWAEGNVMEPCNKFSFNLFDELSNILKRC